MVRRKFQTAPRRAFTCLQDDRDPTKIVVWDGSDPTESPRKSRSPPVPDGIVRASDSFPFVFTGAVSEVHETLLEHLPSYERACYLAELYVEHAAWLFRGVTKEQIIEEMLPFIYGQPVQAEDGTAIEYSGPHDLALLYLIFAIGCLVDFDHEPRTAEATQYEQCARAAMSLKSVWVKPSLTTVQALHLFSIYNAMAEDDSRPDSMSMEFSWGELSLAAQVCQIVSCLSVSSYGVKLFVSSVFVSAMLSTSFVMLKYSRSRQLAMGSPRKDCIPAAAPLLEYLRGRRVAGEIIRNAIAVVVDMTLSGSRYRQAAMFQPQVCRLPSGTGTRSYREGGLRPSL